MAQSRLGQNAILVPIGTTAERPSSPEAGEIRFNTDLDTFEGYDGFSWGSIGRGLISGVTAEFDFGSAASPSITFDGDTSTGLFRPDADTLAAATNGSEHMRINSAGNVGIGTSSPDEALDVEGTVKAENFQLTSYRGNEEEVEMFVDFVNGDDNNTGFSGDPVKTAKAAIEKAPPFAITHIMFLSAEGTYVSNVSTGDTRNFVTIPSFTANHKHIRLLSQRKTGTLPDIVFESGNILFESTFAIVPADSSPNIFVPSGNVFTIAGYNTSFGSSSFSGFSWLPLSNNQDTNLFSIHTRTREAKSGWFFKFLNGGSRVRRFRLLNNDQGTPTGGVGDGTHTGRLNVFNLRRQSSTANQYVLTSPLSLTNEGDGENGWFYRNSLNNNDHAIANPPGTDIGFVSTYRDTTDSYSYAGSISIGGSLSKSSGSFKIDHPLPEKSETHHLVHSFVESPLADNMYRGVATLTDGMAHVNIDAYVGMTEGTFSALNGNPQIFLQNESGFEPVKGHVTDSILHIQCRDDTSTDTISWMVVAERQDQHMLDTEWTDEFGRPVLEPEKNPDIEEEELDSDGEVIEDDGEVIEE